MIGVKKRLNRHQIIASTDRLDPLKYNRGQLIQSAPSKKALSLMNTGVSSDSNLYIKDVEKSRVKNVINVDWFETTILMQNPLINKSECIDVKIGEWVVLVNTFKHTKHYSCRWRVIYLGEEIGTLLTNPSSKIMVANQAQFKMENKFLYTCDWLDIYKEIITSCNWIHNNLTRLDIAIDGRGATMGKELASKFDSSGKNRSICRKGKARFRTEKDQNNEIKKFFVGSSSSDKVATIYHKSKELETSGKEYIRQSWIQNGLDINGQVDRFELRLQSKKMKHYNWMQLDEAEYLSSIVRTECKNWFEFFSNSKDSNKYRKHKNNQKVEWIDWDSISGKLLPKDKAVVKTGIHRAKRIIKDLRFMEMVEGMTVDNRIISELINEYSLQKWYADRIDHWQAEFRRERKYRNISSN